MILPQNENDDEQFISLVDSFVRAYRVENSAKRVVLIHIDNWFGERWLGFAGKFRGIAGIRQRNGKLGIDGDRSLSIPPFRPTRVQDYAGFDFDGDTVTPFVPRQIHREKNGGCTQRLLFNGLYVWYSGNTSINTNGCLMVYELNRDGQNAWYLQFQKAINGKWDVVSCRNTQLARCRAISELHYQKTVAGQTSSDHPAATPSGFQEPESCSGGKRSCFRWSGDLNRLSFSSMRFGMRHLNFLLMAYFGLMAGVAIALCSGPPSVIGTLGWACGGVILFLFIQLAIIQLAGEGYSRPDFSAKPAEPVKRAESQGSFADRMERFAQNVDAAPSESDDEPKNELWVDPDLDDYEVTPPKPIGIIRMLLHRIRRVLSGR